MAAETTTQDVKRSDARKVRAGSVWSRHSFGTVTGDFGPTFKLKNEAGYEWEAGRDIVEHEFTFADQFERTEVTSRTKLVETLVAAKATAVTVNFHKKPDPKDIATKLREGQGQATLKAWRDRVDAALLGEERTMAGHHFGSFDEHGRLEFIEAGKGPRTVDPRTINWAIVNRVRYEVRA